MAAQKKESKRKREIIDAFMNIYLHKELSDITVKEVCDRIHMSRTSFYYYFENIEEIHSQVKTELIQELSRLNATFYQWDLKEFTDELCAHLMPVLNYIRNHEIYFKALIQHRDTDSFYDEWSYIIKRDFRMKYEAEGIKNEHLEISLEISVAAIIGIYMYWLYHLDEIHPKDILRGLYEQVCAAFHKI